MNINDNVLYNLLSAICNSCVDNLADELKSALADYYDISEINVLYYDENIKEMKNILKNFEPAEYYYSEEKMKIFQGIFEKLCDTNYVINDDINSPDDAFDSKNVIVKTISLPVKHEGKTTGLFRIKFRNKIDFKQDDLKFFNVLACNISLKVMSIVFSLHLHILNEFYKSMKDIAKIVESQYDFQYIIPLIGEIIDRFVLNHLVYIFIKNDENYSLYWPSACWNKSVYDLIEGLKPSDDYKITEDKKTGAFPLVSEGEIIGCIVAHSTIDKLLEEEISYISELAKQAAITVERANTYSEMLQNATMDALTGLNNRRQFEIRLSEQYSAANRQNTPLCAIMTDIDFFKKFNDTYGHATGDLVLKNTASVIKNELREYDIASRYGGEEFCILLPQTSLEEAKIVAERLRSAVENMRIENNDAIRVTISVGLAELDIKDMAEDLYMKADRALYEAKESGRNRVVVYNKKGR
ncbi:MAG: sensor domain-containing diguanylate cyclase [Cyanobacteria bacterium RUI128]|nr:sensor domain-containing diguanylate cyclase [Cyanobacteria bacterium RUI128]